MLGQNEECNGFTGEGSISPVRAEGQEAGLDKWGVDMTPRKEGGRGGLSRESSDYDAVLTKLS